MKLMAFKTHVFGIIMFELLAKSVQVIYSLPKSECLRLLGTTFT